MTQRTSDQAERVGLSTKYEACTEKRARFVSERETRRAPRSRRRTANGVYALAANDAVRATLPASHHGGDRHRQPLVPFEVSFASGFVGSLGFAATLAAAGARRVSPPSPARRALPPPLPHCRPRTAARPSLASWASRRRCVDPLHYICPPPPSLAASLSRRRAHSPRPARRRVFPSCAAARVCQPRRGLRHGQGGRGHCVDGHYAPVAGASRRQRASRLYHYSFLNSGYLNASPPLLFRRPQVMRNIVPVIMAGILGIYGLIVAAILVGKIQVRRASPTPTSRARSVPCPSRSFLRRTLATLPPLLLVCVRVCWFLAGAAAHGQQVLVFCGFLALGGRAGVRPVVAGGRACHWRRRRRGRARRGPAGQALRRHDSYPHFRRGAGPLRPHRRPHPLAEGCVFFLFLFVLCCGGRDARRGCMLSPRATLALPPADEQFPQVATPCAKIEEDKARALRVVETDSCFLFLVLLKGGDERRREKSRW